MEKTVDWGGLPEHLLDIILEKINCIDDINNFASVCMRWDSVFMHTYGLIMFQNQVPMLMIPTKDKSGDMRSLFCITENKTLGLQLKVPYNKRCSGSSHGWLAFAEDNLAITLLNPVTGQTICLPPVMKISEKDDEDTLLPVYDINKVILSADPSVHPYSYEVTVKFSDDKLLAFIKAGEEKWTRFPLVEDTLFISSDMIYHKGRIYGLTLRGKVVTLDTDNLVTQVVVEKFMKASHAYLVELTSGILVIVRRCFRNGLTSKFKVYKLTLSSGKRKQTERVYSLDGDALFVGDNCSVSIVASNFPRCKPNCIYFSDDFHDTRPPYEYEGPNDMGIFNMENESIEMHYAFSSSHMDMPPPLWFLPNFTPFH